MALNQEHLDKALAAIAKKYPKSIGEDRDRNPARISTGSVEMDYILAGGIPMGHITLFWGDFSAGKSLTCWDVAREAQNMGLGPVVFYNLEKAYHPDFAEARGVKTDPANLIIVEGSGIEETGNKLEALMEGCAVHIVDSASAGISISDLESNLENFQRVGVNASAWQRALQRAQAKMTSDNVLLMVTQARDSIGSRYEIEHAQGGRYLTEYAPSVRVKFTRGRYLYYDKDGFLSEDGTGTRSMNEGVKEPDGITLKAKVDKSKLCKPYRTAHMMLDFKTVRYDRLFELEKAARHFDIVKTTGSWITLPSGEKVQGRKGLRKALAEDLQLQETIKKEMSKTWA